MAAWTARASLRILLAYAAMLRLVLATFLAVSDLRASMERLRPDTASRRERLAARVEARSLRAMEARAAALRRAAAASLRATLENTALATRTEQQGCSWHRQQ